MISETVNESLHLGLVSSARKQGIALPPMQGEHGRVPLNAQDKTWDRLCGDSDDPLINLKVALELQAGHLGSAGLLLISANTLEEALQQLPEYAPLIGQGSDFHFEVTDQDAVLSYYPRYQVRRQERVEAFLACILRLTRWVTSGRFIADALCFQHKPRATIAAYEQLLNAPLHFNSRLNCLRFSASQLSLPLIGTPSDVQQHLRRLTDRMLHQLTPGELSVQVRELLIANPHWNRDEVARALSISSRHLHRRLTSEKLSFKGIRDRVLQEQATQLLQQKQPVSTVAAQLGFADENSFTRAFRRWTGTSPARYRNDL